MKRKLVLETRKFTVETNKNLKKTLKTFVHCIILQSKQIKKNPS